MNQRVDQDTDTISTTYQQYLASQNGNGRRLLAVPINDPTTNEITGYATFFLPLGACGTGNNDPCCAEFVGKGAIIGGTSAGPSTGSSQTVSRIRLFSGGY